MNIKPVDKSNIFNYKVSLAIEHQKNNEYLYMIIKSRSKNKWYINPYQEYPYKFFEISDEYYSHLFPDENPIEI